MSHTYRINPETHEEEVERRHLKRKKKQNKDTRTLKELGEAWFRGEDIGEVGSTAPLCRE